MDLTFDWCQFWQSPSQRTAFADGVLNQSYDQGELRRLFDAIVDPLTDDDEILDVACGNGAAGVALLAAAERKSRRLRVVGLDPARINPPAELAARITFIRGEMEHARLADNSYAAVVSCFGFEFCPPTESLRRILRALRLGGAVHFLIHAEESTLVRRMMNTLAIYDKGLAEWINLMLSTDAATLHDRATAEWIARAGVLRSLIDVDVAQRSLREHLFP